MKKVSDVRIHNNRKGAWWILPLFRLYYDTSVFKLHFNILFINSLLLVFRDPPSRAEEVGVVRHGVRALGRLGICQSMYLRGGEFIIEVHEASDLSVPSAVSSNEDGLRILHRQGVQGCVRVNLTVDVNIKRTLIHTDR